MCRIVWGLESAGLLSCLPKWCVPTSSLVRVGVSDDKSPGFCRGFNDDPGAVEEYIEAVEREVRTLIVWPQGRITVTGKLKAAIKQQEHPVSRAKVRRSLLWYVVGFRLSTRSKQQKLSGSIGTERSPVTYFISNQFLLRLISFPINFSCDLFHFQSISPGFSGILLNRVVLNFGECD